MSVEELLWGLLVLLVAMVGWLLVRHQKTRDQEIARIERRLDAIERTLKERQT